MSQFTKGTTSGTPVIPPEVPEQFITDNGTAIPAANILDILGGVGIETTGAGNTVTINVINHGFAWSDQTTNFNAAIQNGYFCEGVLTVTLPASPTQGNTIIIYVDNASEVTVQANTGQTIQLGEGQTTTAGTVVSTSEGSVLTLVYREADTEWHSIANLGTWTLN